MQTEEKLEGVTHEETLRRAREVLDRNWTGTFTMPSHELYPQQWSWDSALTSMGLIHVDQGRAQEEMRSLFRAQWENGLLPHIVFSGHAGNDYFPGADYWDVRRNPYAPRDVPCSGLAQPPLHASAVLHLLQVAPDREDALEFAKEMYPKLRAWHDYLYRERDPRREGLAYICHPWESGRDNSPVWDEVMARIQFKRSDIPDYRRNDSDDWIRDGRPSNKDYDVYIYLCEVLKRLDFRDADVARECPFLVQDLLFNSILCQAEQDMAELAEAVGADPVIHRRRGEWTAEAFRRKLWDNRHDIFLPHDLRLDRPLQRHEIGGFSPLFAGIPDRFQARRCHEMLDSEAFGPVGDKTCFAVPSYSREDIDYDPTNYWRGPVWLNIGWLIGMGLRRYGYSEHARWLFRSVRELPRRSGFRERYHTETGEGEGVDNFSWSAAVYLHCHHEGLFEGQETL